MVAKKARKSVARPKPKRKKPSNVKVIKLDLSGWDMGDQQYRLADLVEIERGFGSVTMTLDLASKSFEATARKMAEEAIRMFFDSHTLSACLTKNGISLQSDDSAEDILIPWSEVSLREWGAVEAVHEKAKEEQWITNDHKLPDPIDPT